MWKMKELIFFHNTVFIIFEAVFVYSILLALDKRSNFPVNNGFVAESQSNNYQSTAVFVF